MKIRYGHQFWEVSLLDDGTLDTVIEVHDPKTGHSAEVRFDGEYVAYWRRRDGSLTERGLRELGREAIEGSDLY